MDGVALAWDAGAGEGERDELLGCRARLGQRVGADEARLALAAPAEAGLDRVAVLGQVVSVEVEADLEPERVAGAEADRGGSGRGERVPHAGRVLRREQQLDAVLAGVAGAGDQ